jgi:polar amino acid transport system substrate-binding protein
VVGVAMKQVILVIFVFLSFLHTSNAREPVIFVTSAYEPYVIDEGKVIKGVFPDIVNAVFHELDIKIEFIFMPWKRGEITVKKGEAFATFPYLITEQRAGNFYFSDPVINFFPKFLYKKKSSQMGLNGKI